MALKFHPLTCQSPKLPSFAMPQLASLRSPKFVMASTLHSTSRYVPFLFLHSCFNAFQIFVNLSFRVLLFCIVHLSINSWFSSFASRCIRSLRRLIFVANEFIHFYSAYYHLRLLFNCMLARIVRLIFALICCFLL